MDVITYSCLDLSKRGPRRKQIPDCQNRQIENICNKLGNGDDMPMPKRFQGWYTLIIDTAIKDYKS